MAARSHGSVSIRSVAAACTLMVSAMMPARSWRLLSLAWSMACQPGTNRLRISPLISVGCTRNSAMRAARDAGDTAPIGAGEFGVAGHVLRNDANTGAHLVGVVNDIVSGHDGRAAGGRHQCGQHADERALARAVRSEQAEDLAARNHEADVIDRQQRAKALADAVDLNGDTVLGLALRFHDG